MDKPEDNYLKNFGMMIPATAINQLRGCEVMGATRQEFDDFKKWFEEQKYQQLQLNGVDIDMWVRRTALVHDHVGYSIQDLFRRWKENPPQSGYGYTSFEIKDFK